MQFGKTLGTACSTFVITNIDDLFVLVTFFAEAASGKNTALKITIG
jgi:cadmium resistance protein CadD (predicted permease)